MKKYESKPNAWDNPVDKSTWWVRGVVQVDGVGGVVDTLIRDFVEKGPQCIHQPLVQSAMETNCFHLEIVYVITQTPEQISIFFFQAVGHWVQLKLQWNRKLLRKGVNGSLIHPKAGVDIPLSSNRIRCCCRWYRRRRDLVWSPTGFAYRSQPEIIVLLFSNFIIFISRMNQYKFKWKH